MNLIEEEKIVGKRNFSVISFFKICYLFTLVKYKWPWGKSLSVAKAVKRIKMQLNLRPSYFPKPSSGPD